MDFLVLTGHPKPTMIMHGYGKKKVHSRRKMQDTRNDLFNEWLISPSKQILAVL